MINYWLEHFSLLSLNQTVHVHGYVYISLLILNFRNFAMLFLLHFLFRAGIAQVRSLSLCKTLAVVLLWQLLVSLCGFYDKIELFV